MESKIEHLCCTASILLQQAKADDLRTLVSSYVPAEHQLFYSKLPVAVVSDSNSDSDGD